MSGIVSELRKSVDSILSIRDEIGAVKKEVFFVVRTWSGSVIGDGDMTETRTRLLPSPHVVEYTHDLRVREGGAIQQGDVLLKGVSGNLFVKSDLDGTSEKNVEKLFEIGGKVFRSVSVTEKYLTFNVLCRPHTNQKR